MADRSQSRGSWVSSFGFIMATAGMAIGLGNLWRFPYITGQNGGGLFVVLYLVSIGLVGLPVLFAELILGRATGASSVPALRSLAGARSPWVGVGWAGVIGASMALTAYAVVAGWALYYTVASARGALVGLDAGQVGSLFQGVNANGGLNLFWAAIFLLLTAGVVVGGVRAGIERWSRVLMPLLFIVLLALLAKAVTLDGFAAAFDFVFGLHTERLSPAGVLEALGHAFFTLGVGVGVVLAYGSYLPREANLVRDGLAIAGLDTLIALVACLVVFPITFTYGLEPGEGPGLVFVTLPVAFAQMPGGALLATAFFGLLFFAALTSSISMLEVPVSFLIDSKGWSRRRAVGAALGVIGLLSIPTSLTGATVLFGDGFARIFGKNWFDLVLDTVSNWIMPLGGLGFALFVGWRLREPLRRDQFPPGLSFTAYRGWLLVLRYFVPLAVAAVFLHAVGVI